MRDLRTGRTLNYGPHQISALLAERGLYPPGAFPTSIFGFVFVAQRPEFEIPVYQKQAGLIICC